MVVPFGLISALGGMAAAGGGGSGGGGGGFGGFGTLFSGVGGSLIGGALGGILGRSKSDGFNRSLRRSLDANTASLQRGVENFERFGQRFSDAFGDASPVFGALEDRVLSDLDDTSRTARLESAFQDRLSQQQRSRGTFSSPSGALQSSFAGLQFQEQLRQQSFGNAMSFQQNLAQPLLGGFFQAGLPNIQGDIGFQNQARQIGQSQALNQSIAGGLSNGFNAGVGFGAQQGASGGIAQLLAQLGLG